MNKYKAQYTWRRLNSVEKSRIDFWLTDPNIRPAILKTDIRPAQIKYTDHLAVSLKVINLSKRGPNFWKMNNIYLKDITYVTLINNTIDQCITNFTQNENNQTLWDYCKALIKEKSIQYAKTKANERKNNLINLEKQLKLLIERNDKNENNERLKLEKEIENIYDFKATGAQIRSRIEILKITKRAQNYSLV